MRLHINKTKAAVILGVLFIALGLAGVAPSLYYEWTNSGSVPDHGVVAASPVQVNSSVPLISGQPVTLSIPSLKLNLSVINGYYNAANGQWNLSLDKVQYATPSTLPNNISGNTLIYGHYRLGVFYTLPRIQTGALVTITTSNNYQFTYRYFSTYATQPTDTSIFSYQGPPMLTLQTCSGSFYQNRQMYQFSYVGYQKV